MYLNYVTEINAFWDWRESNSKLSPSAIALWFALMSTANKAGWPKDFSVAISTLQSKTGAGKDAIYTARNQLQQKGRIEFRERKGNQSAMYTLIPFALGKPIQIENCPFVSDKPTQIPTQYPTQVPTQSPTQTPNINKLKETKVIIGDDGDDACARAEIVTPLLLFVEFFGREPAPAEVKQCSGWLETWGVDLVSGAFERACAANVKSASYVAGILRNCQIRGVSSVEGMSEDDKRHTKAPKIGKAQNKSAQTAGSSIDKDALDAYISGQFADRGDKV